MTGALAVDNLWVTGAWAVEGGFRRFDRSISALGRVGKPADHLLANRSDDAMAGFERPLYIVLLNFLGNC